MTIRYVRISPNFTLYDFRHLRLKNLNVLKIIIENYFKISVKLKGVENYYIDRKLLLKIPLK
jgi:hypothetical protein